MKLLRLSLRLPPPLDADLAGSAHSHARRGLADLAGEKGTPRRRGGR
jgi:hypothetical protein